MTIGELPSFEAMVTGLQRMYGLDREPAERAARRTLGMPDASPAPTRRAIGLSVTLEIPWSGIVSDNRKAVATSDGRVTTSKKYGAAKRRAADVAREQVGDVELLECPLSAVITVEPPNDARRDVVNVGKALLDALQGVVYTDDRWLEDVRFLRGATNVDRPHVTITVSRLPK